MDTLTAWAKIQERLLAVNVELEQICRQQACANYHKEKQKWQGIPNSFFSTVSAKTGLW